MSRPLHICHLSLLNPAIHSRIFYKMARTQVQAGHRVTVVAQDPAPAPYVQEGVAIVPLGRFGRLDWRRLFVQPRIARIARDLKADVYQVHTVELLPLAHRLKRKSDGAKVVYDMHEDYVANILHADYYGGLSRAALARRVRRVQDDFAGWGDGLILAEDCFAGLISFPPARTAIVRNKFQGEGLAQIAPKEGPSGLPYLLYTGTIAENWGIWRSVELWMQANRSAPVGLVVVGHTHDHALLAALRARVADAGLADRFLLVGGAEYVPHSELLGYVKGCLLGLGLYTLRPNIVGRIPTKFYEFMACGKPLAFTANAPWDALNAKHRFGVGLHWPLRDDEVARLLQDAAIPGKIADPGLPPAAWSWETEAPVLLQLLDTVCP